MNDKMEMNLVNRLVEYSESDYYGFHMPGHKRNIEAFGNALPYGVDITEIEGFDDLHHCEGILLESRLYAAEVFKAEETFYLINGSTAGNLSAIMSVTNRGDKILIARNNHKSVYNAVFLNELKPVYIYPQFDEKNSLNGEISKEEIKCMLMKDLDIKAVVIVSPTYDGVISDIQGIAEVVHGFDIPLIVDEAHGAHLGMHQYFPKNSNELGADIVIHSVHKTLPSLTQTGLLHVNGSLVDRKRLSRYLTMLQSSSPSYVLMASIDRCVNMIGKDGPELFDKYVELLDRARMSLRRMKKLELLEVEHFDKSKILISTRKASITSKELYNILLEKYHLQMEMCGENYVTAMTSIGDTKEGMDRLVKALFEIDSEVVEKKIVGREVNEVKTIENEIVEMKDIKSEMVMLPRLEQAEDKSDGSEWFYYLYPPGIPFVVPGEIITDEVKLLMRYYEENGFTIRKG